MNKRNLRSVDLNLLVMLDVLLEEKHITKAAERLNISQSAMSKCLTRIRETFDDPILDRVPGGYEPTIRAARLAQPVKEVLADIEEVIASLNFDPSTTSRTFTISSLDYAELMAGYTFMQIVQEKAPFSKIEFVSRNSDAYAELYKGKIDVVIRLKPEDPPENIIVDDIINTGLVCLVDSNHPLAKKQMSMEDFLHYPHCVLHTGTDDRIVDKALRPMGFERKIQKISPNFMAAIVSLKNTNMIMSVPECTVDAVHQFADVSALPIPFDVPALQLSMLWHKRNQDRPGHVWYREHLRDVLSGSHSG